MEKAWHKGISPYEFRKSRMDDLNFIFEFQKAKDKIRELQVHEQKVKELMEQMNGSR